MFRPVWVPGIFTSGDERFIRKNWSYCLDSNTLTGNVRLRTKDHIVLDLIVPLSQESLLMREIQAQVQSLLSQSLADQQVVQVGRLSAVGDLLV
jgi:hypothetical protein